MRLVRRVTATVFITLALFMVAMNIAAAAQQPRVQGPPPADCEQALRENNAYRDRIASLERQVDATNEDAKTWYIRAAHLEELAADQDRLVSRYRELNLRMADRLTAVERENDELRAAARKRHAPLGTAKRR